MNVTNNGADDVVEHADTEPNGNLERKDVAVALAGPMTQSFTNDVPNLTTTASPLAASNRLAVQNAQHEIDRKMLQSQGGNGQYLNNSAQVVNVHSSVDESASYPGSNSGVKTRASSNIVGMQRVPQHRKTQSKTVMNSQALAQIKHHKNKSIGESIVNQAQKAAISMHQMQEDVDRQQSPEIKAKTMRGPKLASYDGNPKNQLQLRAKSTEIRNRLRQSLPTAHASKIRQMAACYDPQLAEELHQRQISGRQHDESILSDKFSISNRRLTDGTSDMQIYKAMSTYLNMTAGTDYNLPALIGEHSKLISQQKSQPKWSFQSRSKLSWFPERKVNFQAQTSPPSTKYSPQQDNIYFKNFKYSQGKDPRFTIPRHQRDLDAALPCQYLEVEPGSNYRFNKTGIGFGKRSDFTEVRKECVTPAPDQYKVHVRTAMTQQLKERAAKSRHHSFYAKWSEMDKVCYPGMEQHFYMRETPGAGSYLGQNFVCSPSQKNSQRYSVPRQVRGLLEKQSKVMRQRNTPAPTTYSPEKVTNSSKNPKAARFKMPRASRDVPFSKYTALHRELVSKGLQ